MDFPKPVSSATTVSPPTQPSAIESAKRAAAQLAVKEHFNPGAHYVGIGSGSTIVYVVEAIQELKDPRIQNIHFVPTGYQSRQVILRAGLKDLKFDSLPADTLIEVAFDGADEIDDDLNCIKGGGACLYQEKLVATRASKFICVADHRKLQPRLLTNWPTIPIEVEPLAVTTVISALKRLGSSAPFVREGHIQKAGPIKTDQDNFIIDAPFPSLLLYTDIEQAAKQGVKELKGQGEDGQWEVQALAKEIKALEGVLSVGLFVGENGLQAKAKGKIAGGQKPVAAYFGMEDGSVAVRVTQDDGTVVLRK
ncbi:ribose-5-phosphate isomerase rki1 [Imshaugia aleurites]|uniref:Ribose-5-phosphate isomerase n=1 Tax=Imshaugia aleurites TaxID=172621 RepID=A0A8H3IJE1_9LECA|nr:ribose-5-phosphate isomerase rki1 [Imshaugia aleurites]